MEAARTGVEIDRLIDQGRWSGLQRLVFFAILLVFLVEGFDNQVLATAIPAMGRDWKAAAHAFALPLALGWTGAGLGTVLGGYLADRIGRKTTLAGALLLFGFATAVTPLVDTVAALSVLRLVAGLGLGSCDPAALTLLAEHTPRRRQGRAIASALVVSLIGIGACGLVATWILPAHGWRPLFLIVGGPPIVLAGALLLAIPESPRFLARRPARRDELIRMLRRMGHEIDPDAHFAGAERAARNPISALFSKALWRPTLSLWGGFFSIFVGVGALFSWAPTLLASLGFGVGLGGYAIAAQSLGGIAGTFLGGALTERSGGAGAARILAAASAAGAAILAAVTAIPLVQAPLVLVGLAIEGGLLSGTMTSLYAAAAEAYPSLSRSTGMGAAGALGRVGAILSSFAGVAALEFGHGPAFFCVPLLASLVALGCLLKLGSGPSPQST